ncbi:MAG: hypothetical protein AB1586_10885 [Pseudomonadota bacterium]
MGFSPSRLALVAVLLIAAVIGGGIAALTFAEHRLKAAVQARWPSGLTNEIEGRSVAANRRHLQDIGAHADVLAELPAALIVQVANEQIAKLRGKTLPAKDDLSITVSDAAVALQPQAVRVDVTFTAARGKISVAATASGLAAADIDDNTLAVNAAVSNLVIHAIHTGFLDPLGSDIAGALNSLIADTLPILNAALDTQVNPIKYRLDFGPLLNTDITKLITKGKFRPDKRALYWSPHLQGTALLIDPQAALIVAKIHNNTRDEDMLDESLPLLRPAEPSGDAAKVDAAYQGFRQEMLARADQVFGVTPGSPAVARIALTLPYVAATLNTALAEPVCGTVLLDETFKPFDEAITLGTPPATFNCTRDIEACAKKSICDSKEQCKDRVRTIPAVTHLSPPFLDKACVAAACAAAGGVGCVLKKVREPIERACTKVQTIVDKAEETIVEAAGGPVCDALREINRTAPAVCRAADVLTAPQCLGLDTIGVAGCTVRTAALDYFAKNPLAKVKGGADAKGAVNGCVTGHLDPDLARGAFAVNAAGQADMSAHIDFDPSLALQALPALGLPGAEALSCVAGFDKVFKASVSASVKQAAGATITPAAEADRLRLTLALDKTTLHFDLDKSPLDIIFARNPDLLIKCSLALTGALAFATWDTAVNKAISPYLTGKQIPYEFNDVKFAVNIPALKVAEKQLTPRLESRSLVFSQ